MQHSKSLRRHLTDICLCYWQRKKHKIANSPLLSLWKSKRKSAPSSIIETLVFSVNDSSCSKEKVFEIWNKCEEDSKFGMLFILFVYK